MRKVPPFSRGSSCLAGFGALAFALLLAAWLCLIVPALAASPAAPASPSGPSPSGPPSSGPLGAASPELSPAHEPMRLSGVGLQLLDPKALAGDTEDGFLEDFRRWAEIFLGEYQTFLPLIAMFAAIGAMALAYSIRRHLRMARPSPQAQMVRRLRNANTTSMPRGPDRSRIKPAPLPPTSRR